jgi:hypothetical protein
MRSFTEEYLGTTPVTENGVSGRVDSKIFVIIRFEIVTIHYFP